MQRWGRHDDRGRRERGLLRVTARALALRCPRCGGGGIFRSWFHLRPVCPTCGLALERGESEDHWFGAVAVNLVAAELLGLGAVVVWIIAAWPDVPWTAVQYAGPLIMIALPVLFYPVSRALWLAWDLHFRPGASGDPAGRPPP